MATAFLIISTPVAMGRPRAKGLRRTRSLTLARRSHRRWSGRALRGAGVRVRGGNAWGRPAGGFRPPGGRGPPALGHRSGGALPGVRTGAGDGQHRFPALALDGAKQRVDSLTSNIGHLLGTGLLDPDEERAVARALSGPARTRATGPRTMSAWTTPASTCSATTAARSGRMTPPSRSWAAPGRAGRVRRWFGRGAAARASVAFQQRLPELVVSEDGRRPIQLPADPRRGRPRPLSSWRSALAGNVTLASRGSRSVASCRRSPRKSASSRRPSPRRRNWG